MKKIKKHTQKECDKLLTPIIKVLSPKCILCGRPTQVAHHHFHKSKSLTLRYNLKNLIPLCNACHFMLGFNESYWACKILEIKGMKWFKKLDKLNKVKIKLDYDKIYNVLLRLI